MKILKLISALSIVGFILLTSILLLLGSMNAANMKILMLIGTILWFLVTPLWMKEES